MNPEKTSHAYLFRKARRRTAKAAANRSRKRSLEHLADAYAVLAERTAEDAPPAIADGDLPKADGDARPNSRRSIK